MEVADRQFNGMPPADGAEGDTLSSALRGALGILRRRWLTLALVAGTIFAAVLGAMLMMPVRYEAFARVRIDPSRSAAMGQLNDQPVSMPDQNIVDTEVGIMHSLEVAKGVVRRLKLASEPEFAPEPVKPGSTPVGTMEDRVAEKLLGSMAAAREKGTYIVDIGFESMSPQTAARVANAFANEYIEYTVGARSGTAERQSQYLEGRLRSLGGQVAAADATLAQYRARTGVVDTAGGTQSVTDQQIASIAGQLATAESDAAAARSKVAVANAQIRAGGIDNVSAVLNSEVIRNLRAQRAELVASQGEISVRYGPKYPETIKINEQLRNLDLQIAEEARRIVGGLESEAAASAARASSLRGDMGRLQSEQSNNLRAAATADTLKRQAEARQNDYNRVAAQAQSVSQIAGSSLSQAQIVGIATPPLKPSKPKKGMLAAAGLLLALVCGVAVICGQELLSSGLRTVADMRRLGLDVLCTIPRISGGGESPADIIVTKPMSSFGEAFRILRGSLTVGGGQSPQVIAVMSTLPNEGKTTSALSLARVMGLAGESVILIDADLRRAGLGGVTGIAGGVGLVELLRGEASLADAVRHDTVSNVAVLPVSGTLFTPEDMFHGNAMTDLLDELRKRYARIIIDTPPLLGIADSRAIAALADAVILAVKWNATPRNAIKTSIEWLQHDNSNLIGAVYTMVDINTEAYGGLYYSRAISKYYAKD